MRVLVTGAAGFIGSELCRELVHRGVEVRAVDNLCNGKRENLDGLSEKACSLTVADIRDQSRMASLMAGVEAVYHLACLGVRHSLHSPKENHEVNAAATLDLLLAARESKVKRFVYVSSSEVYGTAQWVPMTEDHPAFPMTVYGASKLAGECYTRAFHRSYGYPTVVVRPFNAYGPRCHHEGDSGEVIPKFLLRCMAGRPMVIFGDGKQTRDFTFVTDTARGIMQAGLTEKAVGHTINLGSGKEVSINELARRVSEVAAQPDAPVVHEEPRPGDVLRLCSENKRASELLGFTPCIGLREGLEKLKQWYQSKGEDPHALLEQEVVHNWQPRGV